MRRTDSVSAILTMLVVVGIAEMKVSADPRDALVTYSLGSCVGLSLYDPAGPMGGLVHCMLPLSKLDAEKALTSPCMFTDTGVLALLQAMFDLGAARERLIAKVAGGANLLDDQGLFRIGERNHAVLQKVLSKNNIRLAGEDVGGTAARTMTLDLASGRTAVRSGGREFEL
jgi:chemotaxis protein CheD